VDKGFSETFAEGENFGVVETEGVNGSLSYPFTPSLTGTLTGSFRRNKTTGIGDTSLGNQQQNQQQNQQTENWGGTLSFSWRLRPGLLLELSYTYTRQAGSDSNNRQSVTSTTGNQSIGIDNSYTENRVKAAVNLSF
jgi:outer membrane receptor for ferrienterochelin and colicin